MIPVVFHWENRYKITPVSNLKIKNFCLDKGVHFILTVYKLSSYLKDAHLIIASVLKSFGQCTLIILIVHGYQPV